MAYDVPMKAANWRVINDTVMGGVSRSQVRSAQSGLRFSGDLSLENNGGFTSARADISADWSAYDTLRMRFKGDGRQYLLTARVDYSNMRRIYYRAPFQTRAGEEMEIEIPFSELDAYAFGTPVRQAPRFISVLSNIRSIGIMLADKNPGDFELTLLEMTPFASNPAAKMDINRKRAIVKSIEQAISEGVPLYNNGSPERCYDVYRSVLNNIMVLAPDQLKPTHRKLIEKTLRQAQGMSNASDQAWALRTTMDALLAEMN